MLGLDLTVQRVLKDKNVFKRVEVPPYECEECGTDFTPCWKAIGTSENDLHLYCEQCVKQAQKRKMKNDHTAVYKKVFQKISEREKELEKQISAGKFDDPVPPPAPTNTTPSAKVATATATPISAATNHTASPATPAASATAHVKSTPSTSTQPQIKPTPVRIVETCRTFSEMKKSRLVTGGINMENFNLALVLYMFRGSGIRESVSQKTDLLG